MSKKKNKIKGTDLAKKNKFVDKEGYIDFNKLFDKTAKNLDYSFGQLNNRKEFSIPTGSLALDLIMGGGYPPGSRTDLFGKEQGGKSTLAYHACGEAVSLNIPVIFWDYEGSTDRERLLLINPLLDTEDSSGLFKYSFDLEYGEQAFHSAYDIMRNLPKRDSGYPTALFVIDSLATMVPKSIYDNKDNKQRARRAAMFSEMLPLIKTPLASKRCVWLDTNQLRENPNAMFGNPEYEPGGRTIEFLSDCRVRINQISMKGVKGRIEEERSINGGIDRYSYSKMFTKKNKYFTPYKEAYLRMWISHDGKQYGMIDPFYDILEYYRLLDKGYVRKIRNKGKYVFISKDFIDEKIFEKPNKIKYEDYKGEYFKVKYNDFKTLVFDKLSYFRKSIRDQIDSGFAYEFMKDEN